MKILFSASHFGFLRNFQSTLRLLAERGHQLHLVADRQESLGGTEMIDALRTDFSTVTHEFVPIRKASAWYALSVGLRLCLDYWRYLDPRYANSPSLRARAAGQVPPLAVTVARLPLVRTATGRRWISRVGRAIERVLPVRTEVAQLIDREKPDLVLLTPLLYFGSMQVDHVRAARHRGVPTMLCVGSWDHLTTKGLIHAVPDRVTVWNEAQKTEAVALHGVPAERVVVTGAPAYDHWFAAAPSRSREEFCRQVGLPPDRPILLYLCSSPFIAPVEVGFVRDWIAGIRSASDARVKGASILVRPHPQNADQWRDVDLSEFGRAALWPRGGANPIDEAARADYFDSMYYSVAVVGVNTSALIESGIVGRPVFTVVSDHFAGTQEGTLHFQHLKNVNGGLLTTATTLSEHYGQLARMFADDGAGALAGKGRGFIESFVRPRGLDRPATPILADAMETLAAAPRAPQPEPMSRPFLHALLYPLAIAAMVASWEEGRLRTTLLRPIRLLLRGVRRSLRWLVRRLVLWPARRVAYAARQARRWVRIAFKHIVARPARWIARRVRTAVRVVISVIREQPDEVR